MKIVQAGLSLAVAFSAAMQGHAAETGTVKTAAAAIMPKVIAWRRDIHSHPELSGRETRTAALVAEHLKALGYEVKTGVGGTGVVGVLKGAKPGKVIALRADMDALPVTEEVDLPFASKVTATFRGLDVGVMHACGHDAHVAMLMGAAEILAAKRQDLAGTVKLIFQPAEEGISDPNESKGKPYGAKAMVLDGVLENPKVDAAFGIHITASFASGTLNYRSGPFYASADSFALKVEGSSTHGSKPWAGVDPIITSAQILLGLQTIISRQEDITKEPAVLTIGAIAGGNRENIIPDRVSMLGTLRTFDEGMRADIMERAKRTAAKIAESAGAKATLEFSGSSYPVTANDPDLMQRLLPTLEKAAPGKVNLVRKNTGSEDFSEYANRVPAVFLQLGAAPADASKVAPNHSPRFQIDETAMEVGVKALTQVALDFLNGV